MPGPRFPAFVYRKNHLCCERADLGKTAGRFGTPCYVDSAATIRRRFLGLDRAFRAMPHTICYAVKANSNLSLLRLLARLGAGFDVVSGGELERVLRAGRRAAGRIVFSGVGKTSAEMDAALAAGILLFNVESEGELELLAERASRARRQARVAMRVNPDVPAETHPYISTGRREHKFGVALRTARSLYRRAARARWLEVAGVSVHIGSQILRTAPFRAAMGRVAALVRDLLADGHSIRYVDAGGGLGISYHGEPGASFGQYASAILAPLRGLNVHLLLEPGRAIVGPAGALLARVLYVKQNGRKRFLIVDAAMNDLLRPAFYGAYHEIVPVVRARRPEKTYDVVGPVCETGDFLALDRRLPELRPGELIAILDAGAYGMAQASSYNTRPRPAEVLVDGALARLIRRRETRADLMRLELVRL
ncbi:MAG: diaminopimelate decarboxylase [Acidobacteria bacterium]|nr:diaminopimelate decarboxylase [Acidobacteriota bacterium]